MSQRKLDREIQELKDRYEKAVYALTKLAGNDDFNRSYKLNNFFIFILPSKEYAIRIYIRDTSLWDRHRFSLLMRIIFGSWNDKLEHTYGTETELIIDYIEPDLSILVSYAYAPSDVPPEYLKGGCTLTRTEREVRSVLSITCPTKGAKE